jgi:hypothetical protein
VILSHCNIFISELPELDQYELGAYRTCERSHVTYLFVLLILFQRPTELFQSSSYYLDESHYVEFNFSFSYKLKMSLIM